MFLPSHMTRIGSAQPGVMFTMYDSQPVTKAVLQITYSLLPFNFISLYIDIYTRLRHGPAMAPIKASLLYISRRRRGGVLAVSVCLYAVIIMPMTVTPAVVHIALLSKHTKHTSIVTK